MAKMSTTRLAAVVGLALVVMAVTPRIAFAQRCYVFARWENENRNVFGAVNTECGSCSGHTPPWGNWGVDSPTGGRDDGTQFMGWFSGNNTAPCGENISSSRPQWNSCTSG